MKKFKFLQVTLVLLVIACTGFLNSCSKDDSPATAEEGEIITPTEIYQSQVVSIEMPTAVPAAQYAGTFAGSPITLARAGENTLMFKVSSSLIGEADLVVTDLGLDLHYTIYETVLTSTPEVELAPLFTDVVDFSESISNEQNEEADIVNQYIASFNAYYETLTDSEKQQLAITYKANSELFSGIIAGDLTLGRSTNIFNIDTQLLKHKLAVLAFGGGVAFVILAPDPVEKALGALVAAIAWKKSKDYLTEFMQVKLKKINAVFNGVAGELSGRGTLQTLTFTDGEAKSFSFDVQSRNIESGDEGSSSSGLTTFFNSHGIFSGAVTNLNDAIEFVNDNLFFSNISLIPVYTMPSNQPTAVENGDSAFFDAMQLSVASNNVTMSNVSFANGAISMKLTVDNPDAVNGDSLETTINYSYQDELNSFSGSFPIVISLSEIDLSGNWIMQVTNPYDFGSLDGDAALYRFVFNESTITFNQITVISDGYQENGSALNQDLVINSYTLDGDYLDIYLEYEFLLEYTCEEEEQQTNLLQNENIVVTYNHDLDKFTGTINDNGNYNGDNNSCLDTTPFSVNRTIEIYRE
ncbi:hypothetical protein DVK85_05875 [Flavobacterium arcticum]|uniref:P/Homo B domain-containing protein n=1 Tax=Flavobacterium arcticum TaxID=1784713 RepID=A0A345HB28_9FLAO|nr:hypothetical protein [Flavobacterium arcticum]AXG73788.1 hypothetical protein DVK85_05875 [Flavobacterium arcticum]KAF2511740.1 hypothetical protein E0W72_05385 [Flavobacterium arcticum]